MRLALLFFAGIASVALDSLTAPDTLAILLTTGALVSLTLPWRKRATVRRAGAPSAATDPARNLG